jgi:hypothetical protein
MVHLTDISKSDREKLQVSHKVDVIEKAAGSTARDHILKKARESA